MTTNPVSNDHLLFNGVTDRLLEERPAVSLDFYSYGILMTKRDGPTETTYAVDPAALTNVLAQRLVFNSGFLSSQTIMIQHTQTHEIIIEYRTPQKSGIWLDGLTNALHVPLPGLILIRVTRDQHQPNYRVYAVKQRPQNLKAKLYNAPLPNISSHNGSICWGTVPEVDDMALRSSTLSQDWQRLLGSSFGNHTAQGKSKKHESDIRALLTELHDRHARRYPTTDLISTKATLGDLLKP